MVQFIRRTWHKYSKLGRGRKKKQVWRKPKGRDNKMREERQGVPKIVKIGYGRASLVKKTIKVVKNVKDLEKIAKNEVVVIGKIGRKKKIELSEEIKKRNIKVQNTNTKKFLQYEKIRKEKNAEGKSKVKTEIKKDKSKIKGVGDKK